MNLFVDGIVFGRQEFGGISKVWENYLINLPRSEVTIDLLVPFRASNQSLERISDFVAKDRIHIDYFHWPARYLERVAIRSRLLQLLHVEENTDIFHSTYLSTVFSKRIRKVATIYDMIPEMYHTGIEPKWSRFAVAMKRQVLENADAVVAISQSTMSDLIRIYPWIQGKRLEVIHLAYQQRQESVTVESTREKFAHLIRGRDYFLFVGRRDGYKNFDILVSLLKTHKEYQENVIVCVGSLADEALNQKLEANNLSNKFVFLGYLPDEELYNLYRMALALVVPSLLEGFGLPILEAMANDCPVVCSETSSLPEVGGNACIYFDPKSENSLHAAIQSLFTRRTDFIVLGRENLQRFSWQSSTKKLLELYKSL